MNCPECHKNRDYDLCKACKSCTNCCACNEITIPVKIYKHLLSRNLLLSNLEAAGVGNREPKWIEITDNSATLPSNGVWVEAKDVQRRFLAMWGNSNDPQIKKWKSMDFADLKYGRRNAMIPTHWRHIQ